MLMGLNAVSVASSLSGAEDRPWHGRSPARGLFEAPWRATGTVPPQCETHTLPSNSISSNLSFRVSLAPLGRLLTTASFVPARD